MSRIYVLLASLLLLGLAATPALADEPLEAEVYRIAAKLYCPVCEQLPLDDCPTQACQEWRDLIRQMLQEGRSEEEIIAYFEARYGEQVRAAPPARGFNLAAWVVPGLAFAAGLAWLVRQMHRWTRASRPGPRPELPAEYLRRAEDELERS